MKKTTTFLATILIAVGTYAQSFQMSAIGSYNTGIFDDGAALKRALYCPAKRFLLR